MADTNMSRPLVEDVILAKKTSLSAGANRQIACELARAALRAKLAGQRNRDILMVAEFMLTQMAVAKPSLQRRTGALLSADEVALIATKKQFHSRRDIPMWKIAGGTLAAIEEFDHQRIVIAG